MITKSIPGWACSVITFSAAALSLRRTLLRATALPTLRLTVKPTRACLMSVSSSGRGRDCTISPDATHLRRVAATFRNSGRRFRRGIADTRLRLKQKGACGLWPGGLQEHGGRQRWPYGYGSHACAGDDDWKAEKCVSSGHSLDQIYSIGLTKITVWLAESTTGNRLSTSCLKISWH